MIHMITISNYYWIEVVDYVQKYREEDQNSY